MGYARKSDEITRDYFDSILISPRYIDSDQADTRMDLWGEHFDTPVMTAALSHLHKICDNAMVEFAKGAKDSGAVHFYGMGEDEELEDVIASGAKTVKIVKPHESDEEVIRRINHAVSHGAFAVGMDIDHALSGDGGYDNIFGLKMKTKTTAQMKEFVDASKVPFVVKGVLSAQDAEKSVEIGASAILVSHHHGMMDYMVPPLMVLPEIVKAVDGQLKIFVDCGIESGADAFKCLALGADAVGVGRALMGPLADGSKGVTEAINRINTELKVIMARTGAKNLKEIDPAVLKFRNF